MRHLALVRPDELQFVERNERLRFGEDGLDPVSGSAMLCSTSTANLVAHVGPSEGWRFFSAWWRFFSAWRRFTRVA
jgi:hypothetical protein